MHAPHRGFALLVSVILTSVSLAIGLALLDVAYKQLLITTTAKQSGIAFYNADSAMECALYYDQKLDSFNFSSATGNGIMCGGRAIAGFGQNNASLSLHTRTFTIPCPASGISSTVTVYKSNSATTTIFASGYNTCVATDPRRIERGLKINY